MATALSAIDLLNVNVMPLREFSLSPLDKSGVCGFDAFLALSEHRLLADIDKFVLFEHF
jgi:hypothetical protein